MKELLYSAKLIGIFVLFIGLVLMKNSESDSQDTVSALVIILGFTLAIFSQIQEYVVEDKAKASKVDMPNRR
jgi:hypothetical protein